METKSFQSGGHVEFSAQRPYQCCLKQSYFTQTALLRSWYTFEPLVTVVLATLESNPRTLLIFERIR